MKSYERIFSLEKVAAIFLSKDLEPVNVRLDYYVEQDGNLILNVSESRIAGAMGVNIHKSEDSILSVWKNCKEYDLVAILKSKSDPLSIQSFANPFKDASVFVAQANIVSMETDTDFSDQRVTKKKDNDDRMRKEMGSRFERRGGILREDKADKARDKARRRRNLKSRFNI